MGEVGIIEGAILRAGGGRGVTAASFGWGRRGWPRNMGANTRVLRAAPAAPLGPRELPCGHPLHRWELHASQVFFGHIACY